LALNSRDGRKNDKDTSSCAAVVGGGKSYKLFTTIGMVGVFI
jgi:hypothetical protein